MKKNFKAFLLFTCITIFATSPESGLLLKSTFDGFSTTPDFKTNPVDEVSGIPRELQMRMYGNVSGHGNSVCLNSAEFIGYPAKNNFNPARGTVSFWVKPVNYKLTSSKNYQVFFEVREPGFRFVIFCPATPGKITFLIQCKKKSKFVRATIENWEKDEWHKLDAVWNSNGMKLYVDKQLQELVFKENPDFPEEIRWAQMWLNPSQGWQVASDRKTAYDELKIYNYCLSPDQIIADYENFFPSATSSEKPLVTVPKKVFPVKCDGVISEGEWEDAASVPVIAPLPLNKHNEPFFSTAQLKYDDENLYIAFTSPHPGDKHKITIRDGELWTDDAVEFHVIGGDGKQRQFIVNPAGTLYDSLEGDKKWNSNAVVAASRNGSKWTAELVIPLKDIGGGENYKAQFGNSCARAQHMAYSWSMMRKGGYADRNSFGDIILGTGSDIVSIDSIGNLRAGKLDLHTRTSDGIITNATVKTMKGSVFTKVNLDKGWKLNLDSGRIHVVLNAKNAKGGEIYRYFFNATVNPPLVINKVAYPTQERLEVRLDYSAAGLRQREVPLTLELIENSTGKIYASKNFNSNSSEAAFNLPLLNSYPENSKYRIEATLHTNPPYSTECDFFIPDMTPFKTRIAVNHSVPSPWTSVKVSDNTVSVLDRVYTFSKGPMPLQVSSRGNKLLQTPPQFTLNGEALNWKKSIFEKNHGDYLEMSSQGSFDGGSVSAQGQLWFDGMLKWDMKIIPNTSLEINSLRLNWSTPREQARYVMATAYTPWENNEINLKWDTREYHSLLWLCGFETGLAWWSESDANWIIDPNKDNIVLKRNDKTVDVEITIIGTAVTLNKTANYTMVLQGTPPRRIDSSFRERNFGASWFANSDITIVNGHSVAGVKAPDNIKNWISLIPEDTDAFRSCMTKLKKNNLRPRVYSMPTHLTHLDPEYDYFFKTWAMSPATTWEAKDPTTGEKYLAEPCCPHTKVGDLFLWRIDKLFRDQKDLDGIYFDIMHVKNCNNELHRCGGTDAFGKKYSSSGALKLRDYTLRVYKLHQKYGRFYSVHAHNAFFPFVHDFSHSWWPGEELFSAIAENPEWGYLEAVSPEAYQSAWNSNLRGSEIAMLLQHERIARVIRTKEMQLLRNKEFAIHALAPSVLYDFHVKPLGSEGKDHVILKYWKIRKEIHLAQSEFHGYWMSDAVTSASSSIKTSWYSWKAPAPYSRVLGIVNTARHPAKLNLRIDWNKLGINASQSRFFDLWEKRPLSLDELNATMLKGHNFLLIGIK